MRSALTRSCVSFALVLAAAALPAAAQNLNVDLGMAAGTASSSFGGAAGQPGTWNGIGAFGLTPLVGLDGTPAGVDAVVSADSANGSGGSGTGDAQALLGDNILDCVDPDSWFVNLSGVDDGLYRLYVYAPSNTLVDTGAMSVGGVALASIPGSNSSSLIEGTSWSAAYVMVVGGTLGISGAGTGASNCAGLSGFQLVGPLSPPGPAAVALNVDFGAAQGAPSSSYGAAAGQPGTWNTFGLGTLALLGTNGALTGVTALVSADAAGGSGGSGSGDAQALLGDNMIDCVDPDTWSVALDGLQNGDYLLHLYAPSNTLVATGNVTANGVAIASMPGSNTSTLIEGTSWDSAAIAVTDGTLDIAATSPGAVSCIGLSGFQLAGPLPPVVPALGGRASPALLALAAAALLATARRRSSARH